jgi:hypothetical protein
MPFKQFDRSVLNLLPLSDRQHDLDIGIMIYPDKIDGRGLSENPAIPKLAGAVISAKKRGATTLMMYGGHVIRSGCAPLMIDLMKKGYITHFATNGAGSIHDFEMSMIGGTCESVAKYISEGQFGLWKETGLLNEAVKAGAAEGLGFGESVGKYVWENNFPYRDTCLLANAYHLQIPATVHMGIGSDIVHEQPNFDGAAAGKASYTDFLIYTESITKLDGGVFLNFGSAVAGPEVYLKALAMARNAAHQRGEKITDITTAVFDLLDITGDTLTTPPKSDPRYYFRPWKTILSRTVSDGGMSYYICGEHASTFPALYKSVLDGVNAS